MRNPLSYRGARRNIVRADRENGGIRQWRTMPMLTKTVQVWRWAWEANPVITVPPAPLVKVWKHVTRQTGMHSTLTALTASPK